MTQGHAFSQLSRIRWISATIWIVLVQAVLGAAVKAEAPFANVFSVQGAAEYRPQGGQWTTLSVSTPLGTGDEVRTAEDGRIAIEFTKGPLIRIGPNSGLKVTATQDTGIDTALAEGTMHVFSRGQSEFASITTPSVSAAIRGTEFIVRASSKATLVQVLDGRVICSNSQGSEDLKGGEEAYTEFGKAPVKRTLVDAPGAIQWTLFYPDVVDELVAKSLAFGEVENLLKSGKSAEARTKLQEERKRTNDSSLASKYAAQEATIALVQGDLQSAVSTLTEADRLESNDPSVLLAHAYVSQAQGDVRGAKEFIEKALEIHPSSPPLLAKYAEILMGTGDNSEAYDVAQRAVQISSADSYVLSVAGFAALTRSEPEQAEEYFRQALVQDSGSGLPHLGLGLLYIKRGELEAGIRSIERASHMEPGVSLYRSYLGKAYFEDSNSSKARHELERAIELDPEDPTPYLYRSFEHLASNKPVKALQDLEDSFALNENRAVFRSRLLLDQDKATRSAGLAKTFKALGFNQVARIEAIKALNRDYTNYSAHLLLADSYADLNGFAIPGIAETLIGRTLSPVNFNSVYQDSSSIASYNEYSSLFDRPITRYRADVGASSFEERYGASALASGSSDNFGYSLQYLGTALRGYREGDTQYTNSVQWLSQLEASPDDTFFFDGALAYVRQGEVDVGFSPYENDPDFHQDIDDGYGRIGYHHAFSSRSHLIGQVLGSRISLDTRTLDVPRPLAVNFFQGGQFAGQQILELGTDEFTDLSTKGGRGDLQYIFSNELVSLNVGGSIARAERDLDERGEIKTPPEVANAIKTLSSSGDGDEGSERGYGYSTFRLGEVADLSLGVNFTRIQTGKNAVSDSGLGAPFVPGDRTENYISPKYGVTFYPTSDLTLRTAYFESVSNGGFRELETLEPTIVSGFNQVFDDFFPGTTSKTVAAGADYKLAKFTYVGSEVGERDLARLGPITSSVLNFDLDTGAFETSTVQSVDVARIPARERFIRNYLYQIITDTIVTGIEHIYSQIYLEVGDRSIDTHTIRTGINYFSETGFFCGLYPTYYNQTLNGFTGDIFVFEEDGNRDFWIVDALAGYQFPNRHGKVVLGLANLLDQDFNYTRGGFDGEQPVYPGIGVIASVSYSF